MPGWREQWDRTQRWFVKFDRIVTTPQYVPTDDAFDVVYAFFQNCWHVKDWLRNDPSVAPLVGDVERCVNDSDALSVCADMANGSKHAVLTDPRTGEPKARTGDT